MKQTKKSITERLDELEKKVKIIMSMINHMNTQISNLTLNKIEFEVDEAVNKKLEYIKNNNKD